jgi:hypothetical protein
MVPAHVLACNGDRQPPFVCGGRSRGEVDHVSVVQRYRKAIP